VPSGEYGESMQELPPKSGLLQILLALRIIPSYEDIEAISQLINDLKAAKPSWTNAQVAGRRIRYRTRRTTMAGAAAALPGTFPGIGTIAQIGVSGGTFTTEIWFLLREMAHLHYEVAAAFDQDLHHEDLLQDLYLAWGLYTGAVLPAREAAKRVGINVTVSQFRSRVPGVWFSILNKRLGATVLTKFGTKRGGIALGRLIPLGVGVGINATVNYLTVSRFGKSSLRIYEELLPGDDDLLIPS